MKKRQPRYGELMLLRCCSSLQQSKASELAPDPGAKDRLQQDLLQLQPLVG